MGSTPIIENKKRLLHLFVLFFRRDAAIAGCTPASFLSLRSVWVKSLRVAPTAIPPLLLREVRLACMGDNDQATRWSVEQMVTTGNKCIRTEYHWVKECIEEGDVSPQRIETARNLSDCMTKALPNQVINNLVGGLSGYEDIPEPPGPTPR